jgi:hypothetical protein
MTSEHAPSRRREGAGFLRDSTDGAGDVLCIIVAVIKPFA